MVNQACSADQPRRCVALARTSRDRRKLVQSLLAADGQPYFPHNPEPGGSVWCGLRPVRFEAARGRSSSKCRHLFRNKPLPASPDARLHHRCPGLGTRSPNTLALRPSA